MVSQELYECWDTFGKGELNLFGVQRGDATAFCVVCDVIMFEEEKKISSTELHEYWESHKPRGSRKSYLEEFTGLREVGENKKAIKKAEDGIVTKENGIDIIVPRVQGTTQSLTDSYLDTSTPKATIFFYDKSQGFWDRWLLGATAGGVGVIAGVAATALIIATAPVSLPLVATIGVVIAGATVVGGTGLITGVITGDELNQEWISGAYLVDYTTEGLKTLGCEELPVSQET